MSCNIYHSIIFEFEFLFLFVDQVLFGLIAQGSCLVSSYANHIQYAYSL